MRALHGHEDILPATFVQVDIAVDPLDGTTLVSQVRCAYCLCGGAAPLLGPFIKTDVTGSPAWELFCVQSTICSSQTMQLCHVSAWRMQDCDAECLQLSRADSVLCSAGPEWRSLCDCSGRAGGAL